MSKTSMMLRFIKMHGLGNDFVIIDARIQALTFSTSALQYIADRRYGIGCDQVIVLNPSPSNNSAALLQFFNGDGGESGACGNGTRCVVWLLLQELKVDRIQLQTQAGMLSGWREGENIAIDMGVPQCDWQKIPLQQAVDTLHLPIQVNLLSDPVAVNVGNPHCVFFVKNVEEYNLSHAGPLIEHHPLFPQRTNVELVSKVDEQHLRVRVWERGAGITRACGTGACAAVIAGARRGFNQRAMRVVMDGGELYVNWREDDHVVLSGSVSYVFAGEIEVPV